jgi:aryl-alcohol dehydrogenase-like predicted oxidoreductase
MRQRSFASGFSASEIGFGAWALGSTWWGTTDDPHVLIRRALELGITFFDTADAYGDGRGETLLGRALTGVERERIQIATKFGYVLTGPRDGHAEGERPQDWSPRHVRGALEASLRRLGTDYVDLYQLHNPRMPAVLRDDLFEALDSLRDEGKLRHYGVALGPAIGWRAEGLHALERRRIASVQTVYNVLERQPGDDFLAAAGPAGAAVIARVPTSSGLLEGRFSAATVFGPEDHRRHRPRRWLVDGLRVVERLRFLELPGERTLAQAAIQYILRREAIASVLPTITSLAELDEFAGAAGAPALTDDELRRIDDELVRSTLAA